ncbi:hypothetical protein [Mumia quercus]|uniref:hypothetical protein n=1 Tax=Mumia quercus TaxID=2976125 RepID=UPI0021D04E70|nr:hypothetical protein [Mumia quercus]
MFLQDGGWLGTAFNLVTLAVSVVLVATVFSGPLLVTLFVVAAACVLVRWGRGIDRTIIPSSSSWRPRSSWSPPHCSAGEVRPEEIGRERRSPWCRLCRCC